MEEADQLSDRIGIIDQGKIIALGTPAELKQRIAQKDALQLEVAGWQPQMDEGLHQPCRASSSWPRAIWAPTRSGR